MSVTASCAAAQGQATSNASPRQALNKGFCEHAGILLNGLRESKEDAVDQVIKHLACDDGAQAEEAEELLGEMMTSEPKRILAALEENAVPRVVVQDISTNPPSKYVDDSCGLWDDRDKRLKAVQSVSDFPKKRAVAIESIQNVMREVKPHCVHRK